jgi:hypothetical protein
MTKVYVGDTGTELQLDTGVSLASATAQSIEARRPDGTTVSWAGTVVESTKVRYISLADTFNQAGDWKLQAKVTLPTGTWTGEAVALRVYRLFE